MKIEIKTIPLTQLKDFSMKLIIQTFVFVFLAISCATTFEKADLPGHWKNKNWEFVFNEDGTCKVGKEGKFQSGEWTYHTFGNTIEIVKNGKVFLSNLTIKSLKDDKLTLEFRKITGVVIHSENQQVLDRVN